MLTKNLIKIGDVYVDPLEITAVTSGDSGGTLILCKPDNAIRSIATMAEAEEALFAAGLIDDPAADQPPQLTPDEVTQLKALRNAGFFFLARDPDSRLFAYQVCPNRLGGARSSWLPGVIDMRPEQVFSDGFAFVDAEDDEPWSITWLLQTAEVTT